MWGAFQIISECSKVLKPSFVLASFKLINSLRFSQGVTRESSGSHQGVIRESSGSHQGVIRESSGSHQGIIIFMNIWNLKTTFCNNSISNFRSDVDAESTPLEYRRSSMGKSGNKKRRLVITCNHILLKRVNASIEF
jgi:hypothetical protein